MRALAEQRGRKPNMLRRPSLLGMRLIFRRQMMGRNPWRDLALTGGMMAALLASAAGLQRMWAESGEYSHNAIGFLARWLATSMTLLPLPLLPLAAMLGAKSVPGSEEFEQTQSILLTRLTPFDLTLGRLLAGIWPLIATVLASCAFWMATQLGWPFETGAQHGFGLIVTAHLVLLTAVLMIGSIGFVFATHRRPKCVWGRGFGVALGWGLIGMLGIFLANPLIRGLQDPHLLIEGLLLFNPLTAVTTALGTRYDLLRTPWLYDHIAAHDYLFTYPDPLATAGLFLGIALVAVVVAAMRLRRAYR